ncbi:MAG: ABC transporter ATP-binding protein [Planctomyces sp.]|jgi:lipoprotein-releasing system ATP-binding protein|nr:ABC transporter ATP-binding protein [Planctomyces sp.]GDX91928.1 lipoprotein-releasing system ATP-binding protein LolD 1 [Planctomycetia bacterium]
MPIVLAMHNVTRSFPAAVPGQPDLTILSAVNLKIVSGTALAIRGPSGCGKSTLLYLAGTLDRPSSGTLEILGQNPWRLSTRDLAAFRNQHIGFIFQDHQLLPQCSVLENVLLPALAGFAANGNLRERALQLIERVGLAHRTHQRPGQLSGGERQRVAVCRALLQQPSLLLADEPTGNLDPATATEIGSLLLEMASENQTALLCVTHSDELAARFPNSLTLTGGTAEFQQN